MKLYISVQHGVRKWAFLHLKLGKLVESLRSSWRRVLVDVGDKEGAIEINALMALVADFEYHATDAFIAYFGIEGGIAGEIEDMYVTLEIGSRGNGVKPYLLYFNPKVPGECIIISSVPCLVENGLLATYDPDAPEGERLQNAH